MSKRKPTPTHPMMNKPIWLQRMEDPDNMTIKERKQWEEETELRAKNKILAQNFEVYIKKQREKMTYEDEHSRKSGIFGRAVEKRIQEQYEDYLGVLNSSSVVFADQNQQLMDAGDSHHLRSIESHTPAKPEPLYTHARKKAVEAILLRSNELSKSVDENIKQQYSLEKMENDKKDTINNVKNAEKELDKYLKALEETSKKTIQTNKEIEQSKFDIFELPKLHKHITTEYKRDIQTLKSNYNSVKYKNNIDLRAAEQIYKEGRPTWLFQLETVREHIRQNGYYDRLQWRSKAVKVLMVLKAHLNTLPKNFGTKLSIDIGETCKNINLISKTKCIQKLDNFTARAIRICSKFDEKYEAVRSNLVKEANRIHAENTTAHKNLRDKSNDFMSKHNKITKSIAKARKHLQKHGIIDKFEGTFQANGWRGLNQRKSLMQYDLMVANRMSREGNDREKLRMYFYDMLLQCSNAGAWQEAFYIYAAMVGCHVPPECKTFKYIFMACKNSLPPQSKRCLLMLEEMMRIGVHGNRNLYHIAFSACAMAGDHRRTGQVFKIMMKDNIKPSSGTYDLIMKTVSKYGKADDSAEIYESLKISGVPERIAYLTALKTSKRYISKLQKETTKYYKIDEREAKILKDLVEGKR